MAEKGYFMPILSQFYGIVIRMYFLGAEHNPPHIHAAYGNATAAYDVAHGELMDGELPPRADRLVREWIYIHQEELLKIWNSQKFTKVKPLE